MKKIQLISFVESASEWSNTGTGYAIYLTKTMSNKKLSICTSTYER